jgi:hypothetical protein
MIYTHVLKLGGGAVRSPLDVLAAVPIDVNASDSDAYAVDDDIGRLGENVPDDIDFDDDAGSTPGGSSSGSRRLRARMPLGTYAVVALCMA